jgi:hypothetical protein
LSQTTQKTLFLTVASLRPCRKTILALHRMNVT